MCRSLTYAVVACRSAQFVRATDALEHTNRERAMNRDKLLVGIGSAVVGASVLVGSAVYSSTDRRDTDRSESAATTAPATTSVSLDRTGDAALGNGSRRRRSRTRDVTRHLDPIFRPP